VAQHTKQTPAEAAQTMQYVFREYDGIARTVAARAGVPARAYDAFVQWAGENQREQATNAFMSLVQNHEITGVAKLARQFVRTGEVETAYSDAEIMGAAFGPGIKAVQTDRGAMLDIKGRGIVSLKQAVREGYVRLSGGRQ
jgi:hypothetical protein